MKTIRLYLVALALLTAGACSSDDGDSKEPAGSALRPCGEVYADGVVFKTAEEASQMCDRGSGDAYLPAAATTACKDGRTLFWNDEGWGYLGQAFKRHAAGAEKVPPEAERTACG